MAQVTFPVWCGRDDVSVKDSGEPPAGVNVNVRSKAVGWNTPLPGLRCAGVNSAWLPLLSVPEPCPLALLTTKLNDPAVPQFAVPLNEFFAPVGSAAAVPADRPSV